MKNCNNNLKITVLLALMVAISILMGKYLAINMGETLRFSLENTPIILSGIAFGPLAGAAVGIVADLVGCLMVGYTINPIVTLGAAVIGILSGLGSKFCKHIGIDGLLRIVTSASIAHVFGSVIIKTAGLAAYYAMPFPILMLWRFLNYIIICVLDVLIINILLKNPEIQKRIREITRK